MTMLDPDYINLSSREMWLLLAGIAGAYVIYQVLFLR